VPRALRARRANSSSEIAVALQVCVAKKDVDDPPNPGAPLSEADVKVSARWRAGEGVG
jgi:hypothetical protein